MKSTVVYTCASCDAQFPKWAGRCSACGAWGTIGTSPEEVSKMPTHTATSSPNVDVISFQAHHHQPAIHHATGIVGFDHVLSGGLVDGSVTLMIGEPGMGKSTLVAQIALAMSANEQAVIYVTGEESPAQIHRRLKRLSQDIPPSLSFIETTNVDAMTRVLETHKPALLIVDSIQTVRHDDVPGEAGSVSQIKACAARITEVAKRTGRSVILIGQVTKDGEMAGPRLLEHIVDTVLALEGDELRRYRLLRVLKHRFGSSESVSLFSMSEQGLLPVEDVSAELLRDRASGVPGSIVTCSVEGHRPLLFEIQSLVTSAGYGTPIRRTTGIDSARLGMLLAVLARRAGINAMDKDVYANAAGGIDARQPSVDLAVATAIASATKDITLDPRMGVFGEIGLGGELRPVPVPDLRLQEMKRLGFAQAIIPKQGSIKIPADFVVHQASTLREALQMMHIV